MYSTVKDLMDKLEKGGEQVITYKHNDKRFALGILLYRVILVDGRVREEETELFRNIAETYLQVSEDELMSFEKTVRELATSSEIFDQFVNELKELPEDKKAEIVSFMRDISISDHELHELEVNLVSQVDGLLND